MILENKFLTQRYYESTTAEVYLENIATGMRMYIDTLKGHELAQKTDTTPVKGGIYGHTLCTLIKNRDITFKFDDPISRFDMELNKWGAKLEKATEGINVPYFPEPAYEIKTVSSAKKITLPQEPKDAGSLYLTSLKDNAMLIPTTDYTVSGKEITILKTGLVNGDKINIAPYIITQTGLDFADITGKPLPQLFRLYIRVPLLDENDAIALWKIYEFPRAKMSGSFTKKGQSEKAENAESTEFTIEKDSQYSYIGRIILQPDEDYVASA